MTFSLKRQINVKFFADFPLLLATESLKEYKKIP